jgi:hypothetical protein
LTLPHSAASRDQHRVRIDLEGSDAELFQMRGPCRLIGERTIRMFGEAGDHMAGKRALQSHASQEREASVCERFEGAGL